MINIIIPTFNEEEYLSKLLDCIKNQTYKNYEVIVADANSKDKTRQIARKYGCKIVKGGLPAVGRNNGANAARGNLLLFLDADVHLEQNFLENALREFRERNLDVAGCLIAPIGNNLIDKFFFWIFNLWTTSTQFFYPNASGACIFAKRWVHEKINGFDESIKLSEDMDYVKRCGKFAKFRILKKVKFYVAMRRFEKEGRIKVVFKLLLSALHRLIFGEIRSDVFRYELTYKK